MFSSFQENIYVRIKDKIKAANVVYLICDAEIVASSSKQQSKIQKVIEERFPNQINSIHTGKIHHVGKGLAHSFVFNVHKDQRVKCDQFKGH